MTGDTSFGFHSLYRAVSSTTGTTPSSTSLRSPSPSPSDDNLQSLCQRATTLGNNISVRLVDLLTNVKNRPAGVHKLATEFLDISRILWSIETNLSKASRRDSLESIHEDGPASGVDGTAGIPIISRDMAAMLDSRLRQTIRDFGALDNLLRKCLDAEKKGAVARLQGRWRKMFADRDLDRMRTSLASAREALRASALALQCSSRNGTADVSIGAGYNGLATALDTEAEKRPQPGTRSATTDLQGLRRPKRGRSGLRSMEELAPLALSDGAKDDGSDEEPSPRLRRVKIRPQPTAPLYQPSRVPLGRSFSDGDGAPHPTPADKPGLSPIRTASEHVDAPPTPPDTNEPPLSRGPSEKGRSDRGRPSLSQPDVSFSSSLSDAGTWMDEMKSLDVSGGENEGLPRIEADPEAMPRWAARDDVGGNAEGLKMTLVSALENQNHRVVEQVLDKGVSPDTTDPHVLRHAVLNHDTESVLLLFLFGADANRADTDGVTPLYSAVHVGYLEGAKVLLKYGADPNLRTANGETPLDLAVSKADWDLAQVLLIYGGDPNVFPAGGTVPLIEAVGHESPDDLVGLLLDYGADPDAKDDDGQTPLCRAVNVDRPDVALTLLDHGADPNFPGPEHPLWPATSRPECLQLLLERGAETKLARGVLELATAMNKPGCVTAFLEAGLGPDEKKDGLYTPLCTAVRDGRDELVRILLGAGADPNAQGPDFPLKTSVVRRKNQMLPLLVKAGAEIRRVPSILETAAGAGNVLAMAWLLRHGADPNERGESGETPLTKAIHEDLSEAVDILLSFGADVDVKGVDWPVYMAVKQPGLLRKVVPRVRELGAYQGLLERAGEEGNGESAKVLREAGAV